MTYYMQSCKLFFNLICYFFVSLINLFNLFYFVSLIIVFCCVFPQSDIGFGKIQTYTKLEKLGEVRGKNHRVINSLK